MLQYLGSTLSQSRANLPENKPVQHLLVSCHKHFVAITITSFRRRPESRRIEKDWIPDQVRDDSVAIKVLFLPTYKV